MTDEMSIEVKIDKTEIRIPLPSFLHIEVDTEGEEIVLKVLTPVIVK